MTVTYFSIDVETTDTNPFAPGDLLSIGIQVVHEDGTLGDTWYSRVEHPSGHTVWGNSSEWWDEQKSLNPLAWADLFDVHKRSPALSFVQAAESIMDFVTQYSDDRMELIFVAHPASFDWPWLQRMLTHADVRGADEIFSWRTLDYRSAHWGFNTHSTITEKCRTNRSEIPHHALHDAIAQAKDLQELLECRRLAEAASEASTDRFKLLPIENMTLTMVRQQVTEGRPVGENATAMLVAIIDRLRGEHDWSTDPDALVVES